MEEGGANTLDFWPKPTVVPVHELVQMVLDDLAFGRTMDHQYSLNLDQSKPPGPTVGPFGTLNSIIYYLRNPYSSQRPRQPQ